MSPHFYFSLRGGTSRQNRRGTRGLAHRKNVASASVGSSCHACAAVSEPAWDTFASALPLPTVAALVDLAIAETDFLGDLDHATLAANAENSADLAAELWEEARGYPVNATVPLTLLIEARHALMERGYQLLCRRETEAADELADARDAGWA